jgi:hypothetical protein
VLLRQALDGLNQHITRRYGLEHLVTRRHTKGQLLDPQAEQRPMWPRGVEDSVKRACAG